MREVTTQSDIPIQLHAPAKSSTRYTPGDGMLSVIICTRNRGEIG